MRCVGLTFYLDLMVPIRGRPPIFQRRGSFFFISPSPKLISNYTNHLAQTPNEEIRRSSWVRVFLQPGHAGVAALARGAAGEKPRLARVRLQRLSAIGNRRNPPPRAENAANFSVELRLICCARAASGDATATPPRSVMNSARAASGHAAAPPSSVTPWKREASGASFWGPQRRGCLADDAVSCERTSLHTKFPANREINREFRRIRPCTAIFVSDQRADSMAYSRIP